MHRKLASTKLALLSTQNVYSEMMDGLKDSIVEP